MTLNVDSDPNASYLINGLYHKKNQWGNSCYLEALRVPQDIVPFVRFINRQVNRIFYDQFAGPMDGCRRKYRKVFSNDSGESIIWTVEIDENDRIVGIDRPYAERVVGSHEDSRPGSDHVITDRVSRTLTKIEIDEFISGIEDVTIPRAELLLSKIPLHKIKYNQREYIMVEDGVEELSYNARGKIRLSKCQLIELIEWSFTYLECFLNTTFILANVPGFTDQSGSRIEQLNNHTAANLGVAVLSSINPRTYYDYQHLLGAAVWRAVTTLHDARSYLTCQSAYVGYGQRDQEEKEYSDFLESCFKGDVEMVEDRGKGKTVRRWY